MQRSFGSHIRFLTRHKLLFTNCTVRYSQTRLSLCFVKCYLEIEVKTSPLILVLVPPSSDGLQIRPVFLAHLGDGYRRALLIQSSPHIWMLPDWINNWCLSTF